MSMIRQRRLGVSILIAALALSLTAWSPARHVPAGPSVPLPVALPGYQVSVFAAGGAAYSHPDSLVSDGTHVFVAYANLAAKDGTDNRTSTIVEYTMTGKVLRAFSTPGHSDGLRINPATHLLWALSNEDGNPALFTIDPVSGTVTRYRFPPAPHGGGYDDIAFVHGMAFIDASNPTLNKAGVNVYPALDKVRLSNERVVLTPVLMGNASAVDLTTNKTTLLNLVDPDSLTFDPQGNLVLDNQSGAQLVFIFALGTAQQYVTSLPIGTQVDDTTWATTAQGRFLISDTSANVIYTLRALTLPGSSSPGFVPGTAYVATQNDSGVTGLVGTVDLQTGLIAPVAIGFTSPHGLLFLPDAPH